MDYPAEIDYILNTTGFSDLFFVGYSMGTTQYFVLLSERPEYNEKIKAGFMMAPCTFSSNVSNPIADEVDDIMDFLHSLGNGISF